MQQILKTDDGNAVKKENNNDDSKDKNNEENGNTIDLKPNANYSWWFYTFNVKGKYFITIEFKAKGNTRFKNDWTKWGVRRCVINGKSAHIYHFYDNQAGKAAYNSQEFIKISLDGKKYTLFYLESCKWCFSDENGIYSNIYRANPMQVIDN